MTRTERTMRLSVLIGRTTCCDRRETTVQSKGSCLQALTARMCQNINIITQKNKQEPCNPPPTRKNKSIYVIISLIRTKTLVKYTHTEAFRFHLVLYHNLSGRSKMKSSSLGSDMADWGMNTTHVNSQLDFNWNTIEGPVLRLLVACPSMLLVCFFFVCFMFFVWYCVGFLPVSLLSYITINSLKIYTPRHIPQEITCRQALLEGKLDPRTD